MDWNPSGLLIFSIYKHGSSERLGDLSLPGLRWLAARAEMVHGVPDSALQVQQRSHCLPTGWSYGTHTESNQKSQVAKLTVEVAAICTQGIVEGDIRLLLMMHMSAVFW